MYRDVRSQKRLQWGGWVMVAAFGGWLFGCAASSDEACRIGEDCASGACASDGRCVPVGGHGGAGGGAVGGGGGTGGGDGGGQAGAGGQGLCGADGDGIIAQSEVVLQAGLSAKLQVAQDVPVDTAGVPQSDGSRRWNYAVSFAGDHLTLVETQTLAGKWFESSFPGASYAARLSDSEDLLGVFEIAQGALLLRGVVSPDGGVTRTELTYQPPVRVLDFPLHEGQSWQSTANVSGLAMGVAALYTEAYTFDIDAHGRAKTPLGEFEVLRLHSQLLRTVANVPTVVQTQMFVSECFGTVATVVSQQGELAAEFSQAAEVRRLSP